jgi:hypothetical protein
MSASFSIPLWDPVLDLALLPVGPECPLPICFSITQLIPSIVSTPGIQLDSGELFTLPSEDYLCHQRLCTQVAERRKGRKIPDVLTPLTMILERITPAISHLPSPGTPSFRSSSGLYQTGVSWKTSYVFTNLTITSVTHSICRNNASSSSSSANRNE